MTQENKFLRSLGQLLLLTGHHFLVLTSPVQLEHSPSHCTHNRLQQRVQRDQLAPFVLRGYKLIPLGVETAAVCIPTTARGGRGRQQVRVDLQAALGLARPAVGAGGAQRLVGAGRAATGGRGTSGTGRGAEEAAWLEIRAVA